MSETGRVWIEMGDSTSAPGDPCPLVYYTIARKREALDGTLQIGCAQCHDWISDDTSHLHIFREFETYRDDPHYPSWIACSEGCAIALIQERGYTVIANPGVVTV